MSGRMRDRRPNKMADKHIGICARWNVRMFASIYVRQIVIWWDHSKKTILAFALNRVESMLSWWQNAHYPRMEYCPTYLHDLGKGTLTPSQTVKAKRNFCLSHLSKQQFDPGFPHPAVWAWHMPPSRSITDITASVDLSGLSWSRRHDANYKSMLQSSLQLVVKQSVAMVHDSRSSWTAWHVQDVD